MLLIIPSLHAGLDYFIASGGAAFDTFESIVKFLMEKGHVSNDWKQRIVKELKSAKEYLKTDYNAHLSMHSNVADHCITYALSDGTAKYSNQCPDESHSDACDQCDKLPKVIEEISRAIASADVTEMEKADFEFQVSLSLQPIL